MLARTAAQADGGIDALKISASRVVLEVIDHHLLRRDEAADRRERLAERPDDQIDLVGQPEVLGRPRAGRTEDADRVRVIDGEPRVVARAQLGQSRQIDDVALHAEDAVDHDQLRAAVRPCRSFASRSLMSPCRNRTVSPAASRQPSTTLA